MAWLYLLEQFQSSWFVSLTEFFEIIKSRPHSKYCSKSSFLLSFGLSDHAHQSVQSFFTKKFMLCRLYSESSIYWDIISNSGSNDQCRGAYTTGASIHYLCNTSYIESNSIHSRVKTLNLWIIWLV